MIANALAYLSGAALVLWGVAHVVPTRAVADGLGEIEADSRRIFVMEWLAEGIAHISIGVLVVLVAAGGYGGDPTADLVYRVLAAALVSLAALTVATGARTPVMWFKVCPLVLSTAAALLVLSTLV